MSGLHINHEPFDPAPSRTAGRENLRARYFLDVERFDEHLLEFGGGGAVRGERDRVAGAERSTQRFEKLIAGFVGVKRAGDFNGETRGATFLLQVAFESGDRQARDSALLARGDPFDAGHFPAADHRPDNQGLTLRPADVTLSGAALPPVAHE